MSDKENEKELRDIMRQLNSINKKQKLEDAGDRQEVTKAQNVTNALFVGSTADLLKFLKKETKENA